MPKGKWNGPAGWKHEVGSNKYLTEDGRGKVLVRFIRFRVQYDAYIDDKLIGTRNFREEAFRLVDKSK